MYQVLLYYCYTPLESPEQFRDDHHQLCLALDLRGRVIVASEGLNGTVSGTVANCAAYVAAVKADPRFAALEFKIDTASQHAFQKLHVRVKPEIVHSSLAHLKPQEKTSRHVSPQEFQALKDCDDVVLVDVRLDYEYNLGRFRNAVTLNMENFRDFPERVEQLRQFKDKKNPDLLHRRREMQESQRVPAGTGFRERVPVARRHHKVRFGGWRRRL